MAFKRFRKDRETTIPYGANEQYGSAGSHEGMDADFVEVARIAREKQRLLGEEAIKQAEHRRKELFGWQSAPDEISSQKNKISFEGCVSDQNKEAVARAERLQIDLARLNIALQSFEESSQVGVIAHILTQRSYGSLDWDIHLGFHPDRLYTYSSDENFQISSTLIRGKGKKSYYPFR